MKTDTFEAMLTAFRGLYDQEIARLVDKFRPRILAGEFSGVDDDGSERHFALDSPAVVPGRPRGAGPRSGGARRP